MRGIRMSFGIVRMRIGLLFALSVMLAGCAGPKVAADLLSKVQPNEKPLCSCSYDLAVTINPDINNFEGIDQSVRDSLDLALTTAKLFTADAAAKDKIKANILIASEAAWSFGSFNGKLKIAYTVLDPSGHELFNKTIYTVAGSDKWYFSGAKRHQRARAVNTAKNILQFVDALRTSDSLK